MQFSRDLFTSDRFLRFVKFAAVGATGIIVNQAALWAGVEGLAIHYLVAAVVATQISTLWNFGLTEAFVFRARRGGRATRWFWFAVMNNAWMVARLPLLWALTDVAGLHYLWSNGIAIVAATVLRFFVADRYIWASPAPPDQAAAAVLGHHHYDIHGIIGVVSAQRLPELQFFRVHELGREPDIEVTIGRLDRKDPEDRVLVEDLGDRVSYIEGKGRFGFGVSIDLGSPIKVRVSGLVGRSPHVLYTNIVEPLLRWAFVRKGYAMIHGACLQVDGKGVLITAQTDTGKTTTCLRAVKGEGAVFLSDDMIIVDQQGTAYAFPKPLTISAHTLKAASAAPLPIARKLLLQLQSRVHSKSGRQFGFALASLNLPVGTLNALTQIMIPPPKYHIHQLLPQAQTAESLKLEHMVVIERGEMLLERVDPVEAARTLLVNTEDAYGFPPYPVIAPVLCNENGIEEAEIFRNVTADLDSVRIRTPDREWYRFLPDIVAGRLVLQEAKVVGVSDAADSQDSGEVVAAATS